MKLRLSLLSRNEVLLVEHFDRYLRFYFSDGHYEIVDERIRNYFLRRSDIGYKRPIFIYSFYLHPTINRNDTKCQWINLDCFKQNHYIFTSLLKQKGLYEKTKKMYLKQTVEGYIN